MTAIPSTYRSESMNARFREPFAWAPTNASTMGMTGYTHGVNETRKPPAKATAIATGGEASSAPLSISRSFSTVFHSSSARGLLNRPTTILMSIADPDTAFLSP